MRRSILALLLLLAACSPAGGPDASVGTTTTAAPTGAEELAALGTAMLDAGSFRFEILLDGPPIEVEAIGGLGVRSATGAVQLPDRAMGEAGGVLGPITISTPFVVVGPAIWLTNPLGGNWIELDTVEVVDIPAALGSEGLPAILGTDVDQVVAEQLDGVTVFRGLLDTSKLSELTSGRVGAGVTPMRASTDLDGFLSLVVFDDPVEVGRTWSFSFSEPGVETDINAP